METGRKNSKFHRGVLENAGLGEVAFFLKKAKQNILYAATALEHTDFSSFDEFSALQANVVRLRDLVAEVSDGMEKAELQLVNAVARREFGADDEGEENV